MSVDEAESDFRAAWVTGAPECEAWAWTPGWHPGRGRPVGSQCPRFLQPCGPTASCSLGLRSFQRTRDSGSFSGTGCGVRCLRAPAPFPGRLERVGDGGLSCFSLEL